MPWGNAAARLRAFKANFGSSRLTGAPATIYIALAREATNPATVLGTEPDSSGNYARVAVSNVDTEWTYSTTGAANTNEIRYPVATGLYSITDPLNQWIAYDNNAGGTVLAFGELTATIDVTGAGDQPVIAAGALVLSEDA